MKDCDIYDFVKYVNNDMDLKYCDPIIKFNKESNNQYSLSLSAYIVNKVADDMWEKGYKCDFSQRAIDTIEYEYPNKIKVIDNKNIIFYIDKNFPFICWNATSEKDKFLKESFEKVIQECHDKNKIKIDQILDSKSKCLINEEDKQPLKDFAYLCFCKSICGEYCLKNCQGSCKEFEDFKNELEK